MHELQSDNHAIVINPDKTPAGEHVRRFNAPVVDDVAGIMVGDRTSTPEIVIRRRDNNLESIADTHRSYEALQYPLIFWKGQDGYYINIKQRDPAAEDKKQFGKGLRNDIVKEYFKFFINKIKEVYIDFKTAEKKIIELSDENFNIKELTNNNEAALLKAKFYLLNNENQELMGKLKMANEHCDKLIKSDYGPQLEKIQQLCEGLRSKQDEQTKTLEEGLKTATPMSYAQAASLSPKRLLPQEREGVLLIKPKLPERNNYEDNKNIILTEIKERDSSVRIRNISPIHGGGIKIITASSNESEYIKDLLGKDQAIDNSFDLTTPGPRSPQIIIYNIEGEIDEEGLYKGLLEKNLFLGDSENKPNFKIEFSIPAKRKDQKHWVLTVPPKLFHDVNTKGGLYFGWHKIRAAEFLSVKQCRNCWAWPHKLNTVTEG
ncbi:hypothetical protein HNY73_021289 [Argiope bruennichi]|uniref:Uncharacterized protein n=1 Tax=Argiope bruennichi TaxID=94029 RepID=A0A8T0ECE5_ARGBR|nr:hypothetical protein HNY73_021289 [Argiope bruennichi]